MMTHSTTPPLLLVYRPQVWRRRTRRVIDTITAALLLLAATPVLTIACIAILLDDGWPVIFPQRRVGRFERLFTMYKLRTMRRDHCGDLLKPRSANDQRITRVGRILRKSSIDELPQMINVLRGEMALIGPRPEMPFLVRKYEHWQHLRHLVTPGLTCIWQTEKRSTIALEHPDATALDVAYISKASPVFDCLLLIKTVPAILESHNTH